MKVSDSSQIVLERISCPLCGSNESKPVVKTQDFFCQLPGDFAVEECGECSHVFLNPRPTRETIGLTYPQHYAPHTPQTTNEVAVTQRRPWYARPPIRWIPGIKHLYFWLMKDYGQVIPPLPELNANALEIGTGRGDFLKKLEGAGWSVRGIEPSKQASAQARSAGYDVNTCSIEDANFDGESFHAIFAWMVLEHLISPQEALEDVYRWLKPGGTFCFSVPNYSSCEVKLFGKYWFPWEVPRHLHQFRIKIIRRLLKDAGFRNTKIIHQRNIRDYYGSTANMLLARNPKSKLGTLLMNWFRDSPPLWVHLVLSPMGIVLAVLRQGGRITVVTHKTSSRK